ncbi:Crp/Fnr family transcriptional regulator [Sphingobacterium sp. HJSM2_6]|uniref:Crp/Fnr family transcriptional regulator n=1 Tax=Sphingobacterium sp. HJSM2_6 TaxID=3366264 RepID=UPI003BE40818
MKEITALATRSVVYKRNEFLKLEGSIDTHIYHIISGSLRVYIRHEDQEQILRLGYAGNLIVSLDSFFKEEPSSLIIQAIKKTEVQIIPKSRVSAFIREEENKLFWIQLMEGLIIQQYEREIDLLTSSPKQRYAKVLRRSPQLFQEVPHKHIANYLRMSPETLSRLKKS